MSLSVQCTHAVPFALDLTSSTHMQSHLSKQLYIQWRCLYIGNIVKFSSVYMLAGIPNLLNDFSKLHIKRITLCFWKSYRFWQINLSYTCHFNMIQSSFSAMHVYRSQYWFHQTISPANESEAFLVFWPLYVLKNI